MSFGSCCHGSLPSGLRCNGHGSMYSRIACQAGLPDRECSSVVAVLAMGSGKTREIAMMTYIHVVAPLHVPLPSYCRNPIVCINGTHSLLLQGEYDLENTTPSSSSSTFCFHAVIWFLLCAVATLRFMMDYVTDKIDSVSCSTIPATRHPPARPARCLST